ncbi:2-oxoisovalerate dehydrogenase subunit alpha [Magnaporthiopsis poae ATCC 64411]|uniref:2-oxoisovalerate dehydrogenase subunit alpha n=1 Tax=Magnaporthiopsis poae (strain ATCC 64411 / 73-15) TaxID=644358 RepID=A0A0C4E3C6_MAGP6|nr:2-oxoisovalerate dehydrogenase subunit alpha [Magnaporthiopsis poae ATCC 64411]
MKARLPSSASSRPLACLGRRWQPRHGSPVLLSASSNGSTRRHVGGLSQKPDSAFVSFPGALKSEFTSRFQFTHPAESPAVPTYRVVDQHGVVVDPDFEQDLSDDQVLGLYRDMVAVSIMDSIMFDAQRQGRISFYMVSAGEEAVCVGSASALEKRDVIFCQYREQGVLRYRGFTFRDYMNQLFANKHDPGHGRNMPVHYGSRELNVHTISSPLATQIPQATSDDSFAYRARVEVEDWKRRDNPISRLRKWMESRGIWDDDKEKEARDGLRKEILKAFSEAEREKKPPIRRMFEDVYEELTPDLKNQMAQLRSHIDSYPDEYDLGECDSMNQNGEIALIILGVLLVIALAIYYGRAMMAKFVDQSVKNRVVPIESS